MMTPERQAYLRKNWKKFRPPLTPIWFIEIDILRDLLENDPKQISPDGFEVMIGAFEELEMYEKAALIKQYMGSVDVYVDEGIPDLLDTTEYGEDEDLPPDDNPGWRIDENTGAWVRPATQEEIDELNKKSKKNPYKKNKGDDKSGNGRVD